MKLIKKQYPIKDKTEQNKILSFIKNKRVEVFDLRNDQLNIGIIQSYKEPTFLLKEDTGSIKRFNINDVEIKV